MPGLIVLCAYQIKPVLAARQQNALTAVLSPDLGLSTCTVQLDSGGLEFPDGRLVRWEELDELLDSPQNCFELTPEGLEKIQAFSEYTNRHYGLMATESAPTMLVSGIPMHRIKNANPHTDTLAKIRAVKPVTGHVLDTATGLGYTAIEAARTAEHVITIELDPTVMEVLRRNPWSQPLLHQPNIEQWFGDTFERITEFEDETFARILHDPPMISLAGELYSTDFYFELYRVLKPKGVIFHYIGDLDSKLGSRVARGASRRLQEAGFRQVTPRREAFGLVVRK
jgi:predicted methyltransferase